MYECDNIEYVDGRLRGTIVRTKNNNPFMVRGVVVDRNNNKSYIAVGTRVGEPKEEAISLSDLLLESPPLGFTNFDGRAWYLGRFPKRRDWKQGIRAECMYNVQPVNKMGPFRFGTYVPLIVPFKNKYPTYSEALERVEDIYDSCSFSRFFAVNSKKDLLYKNQRVVGRANEDRPVLMEDFNWLEELLQEHMNVGH